MRKAHSKPFALCIASGDYKASLIPGKVCKILPDRRAATDDLVRIDHESHFALVDFTPANVEFWLLVGRCAARRVLGLNQHLTSNIQHLLSNIQHPL